LFKSKAPLARSPPRVAQHAYVPCDPPYDPCPVLAGRRLHAVLLANIRTSGVDPVQTQNALQARVARLRARAARLRGSVLTGPERQRLARGLQ